MPLPHPSGHTTLMSMQLGGSTVHGAPPGVPHIATCCNLSSVPCPCPTQFSVAKIPSPRPAGLWRWKGITVLHDPHLTSKLIHFAAHMACQQQVIMLLSSSPLHQGSSASLKRPAGVLLNSQTKINNFFSKSGNQ